MSLCFHDTLHVLRLLAKADFISGLHEPRGDVALYAVYINVAVAHDLASREDRRRELGAVDNSIQTAFQETDKVLASVALHTGGDRKRVVEGKSVSVRVGLGGRRCIKKKKVKKYN